MGSKWETSGRQVNTHMAQSTQSGKQVGDNQRTEEQVGDKWETSRNYMAQGAQTEWQPKA